MFDYKYRLWLTKNVGNLILQPTVVAFLWLRSFSGVQLSASTTCLIYLSFIPLYWIVRVLFVRLNDQRKAREAGYKQAYLIQGKKWGHTDLAARCVLSAALGSLEGGT